MLAMKKELDAIKKEKGAVPKQESAEGQAVADMHKEVAPEVAPPVVEPEGPMLGTTKFYLAGWAEGPHGPVPARWVSRLDRDRRLWQRPVLLA